MSRSAACFTFLQPQDKKGKENKKLPDLLLPSGCVIIQYSSGRSLLMRVRFYFHYILSWVSLFSSKNFIGGSADSCACFMPLGHTAPITSLQPLKLVIHGDACIQVSSATHRHPYWSRALITHGGLDADCYCYHIMLLSLVTGVEFSHRSCPA